MEDIHLHIDRLILDGFDLPAGQHGELQSALAEELTTMLANGGLNRSLASGGAYYQVPSGQINLPNPPEPGDMGRQIAGAVFAGLGRGGRASE